MEVLRLADVTECEGGEKDGITATTPVGTGPCGRIPYIRMPEHDGYELLASIRSDTRFDGTFDIMLTGRTGIVHMRASFAAGADDYLRKPFITLELVARVRRAPADRAEAGHTVLSDFSGIEK